MHLRGRGAKMLGLALQESEDVVAYKRVASDRDKSCPDADPKVSCRCGLLSGHH